MAFADLPPNVQQALSVIASYVNSGTDTHTDTDVFRYTGIAQVYHIEDGDTWYGAYRPDPTLTVAKPAETVAPQGVSKPGQWHRLVAIDTHETDAESKETRQQAREEKQFFEDFVEQARQDSPHDWPFTVAYTGQDYEGTFGRELTDLVRRSDGRSLTQALYDEFGESVIYEPAPGTPVRSFPPADSTGGGNS